MPYLYQCDGFCDADEEEPHDERPAFTGEFNEDWLEDIDPAAGDRLKQAGYEPHDLVTLCPDCVEELLIHRP